MKRIVETLSTKDPHLIVPVKLASKSNKSKYTKCQKNVTNFKGNAIALLGNLKDGEDFLDV